MSADETALEPPAAPQTAAAPFARLMVRPTLLLVAGYVISTSLHELAHALAALWLGVPSTLFHSHVAVDLPAQTPYVQGFVRAAGPIFSLVLGVLCWFTHRALRGWWLEAPLFYVAVFGVANFLGNTFAVPWLGDFSGIADSLGLSPNVRYAIAGVGGFLLAGFAFDIGRELREWAPPGVGAIKGTAVALAGPALAGTALLTLIYQPLAPGAAEPRLVEAAFWIFATLGALVGSVRAPRADVLPERRVDWLYALLAVLVLRVIALGIPFVP